MSITYLKGCTNITGHGEDGYGMNGPVVHDTSFDKYLTGSYYLVTVDSDNYAASYGAYIAGNHAQTIVGNPKAKTFSGIDYYSSSSNSWGKAGNNAPVHFVVRESGEDSKIRRGKAYHLDIDNFLPTIYNTSNGDPANNYKKQVVRAYEAPTSSHIVDTSLVTVEYF